MKIAFIGQKGIPAKYGGVERHVEELSVRLADKGFKVVVYTRPWYTDKNLKEYKGVKLVSIPTIKTKHLDAITHSFLSTIHAIISGCDIIHYQGVGPSLVSWIARFFSSAKVITTFHCIDRFHQKWGVFARFMLRLGEWTANKFANETIAVSKTISNYCALEFRNVAHYIPNGIGNFDQEISDDLIKQKFNLQKNEYIIMVSRLIRHKGAHFLIEAFNNLKTDKKLVIVGDSFFTDDYVKELKDLAKSNPNIIFTGFQSGKILEQLFANAYLFVLPSLSEGLPISVLEAMNYGTTVLVSDIPENLEIVGDYAYGVVFEKGNVKDLQEKLEFLLENPDVVESYAKSAKKYVAKEFNWDDIAEKTAQLYKVTKYKKFLNKRSKAIKGKKAQHQIV